jgi:hypothetical protein
VSPGTTGTDKVIPKVNPHNLNLLWPFLPKTVPCPSRCRSSNSGKYSGEIQSGSSGSSNEVNLQRFVITRSARLLVAKTRPAFCKNSSSPAKGALNSLHPPDQTPQQDPDKPVPRAQPARDVNLDVTPIVLVKRRGKPVEVDPVE